MRVASGRAAELTAAIIDSRTLRSTPESGPRAGYDGAKRKRGSKLHMAVAAVQEATGERVEFIYVDQGYTGAVQRALDQRR